MTNDVESHSFESNTLDDSIGRRIENEAMPKLLSLHKKHKVKVKTYAELKEILAKEEERRFLEQEKREKKEEAEIKKREKEELQKKKEEENKRLQEEQKLAKEERITASGPSSSDIGARLKKLRQMYKDGILSKIEFEKAKNKLLK